MTDRELLELAAKAAGLETKWDQLRGAKCGSIRARIPGSGCLFPIWNPLTDDGDALRLAVKLNLTVKFDVMPDGAFVSVGADWGDEDEGCWCNEFLLKDQCAATRRAIVRAAAAITQENSHD